MKPIFKGLAALALALLVSAGISFTLHTYATNETQLNETQQAALSKELTGTAGALSAEFNGPILYQAALEAIRDYHITLVDENRRRKWSKEWESKYDRTGQLSTQDGADLAIEAMIRSLNQRFDHYDTPEERKQAREQIDSSLVGIGVQVTLTNLGAPLERSSFEALRVSRENSLVVGSVVEGGPAQKSGLKEGDIIHAIDSQPLIGKSMSDVLSSIRGNRGSKVTLTVERMAGNQPKRLVIKIRRDIVVNPVVHYKDIGEGIAYVRLDHFLSKHAVSEMAAALEKAAGQKGLILDLRHNPGGELQIAVEITAMLLPEGSIVELRSRDGNNLFTERVSVLKDLQVLESLDKDMSMKAKAVPRRAGLIVPREMPIVVLVNEYSASAAELLSGALQKSARATIVGAPTMGKGVGQAVIDLPYNRSVRVTNFEFLPAAEPIDWVGIIPDIISPSVEGVSYGAPRDRQLHSAAIQALRDLIAKAERADSAKQEQKRAHRQAFEAIEGAHNGARK
ncbi:MAG: PDZ domain-containing protein [Candidatus Melainabacteria bacterium]|nr:PDZ domain-containing protein [Candidatus Melainabacteria bacterium]